MRYARRASRGIGMLTILCMIVALAGLLAAVTAGIASLADASNRYACTIRSRALAEGGIEAALAQLPTLKPGEKRDLAAKPETENPSGFDAAIASTGADELTIASRGRLVLARRQIVTTIDLKLKRADGKWTVSSRNEATMWENHDNPRRNASKAAGISQNTRSTGQKETEPDIFAR